MAAVIIGKWLRHFAILFVLVGVVDYLVIWMGWRSTRGHLWSASWLYDVVATSVCASLAALTIAKPRDNACVLAFVLVLAGAGFAAWGLFGEERNWNLVIFGPLMMGGMGTLCAWHWVKLVRRDQAAAEEVSQAEL
jgi:hypothetical protein